MKTRREFLKSASLLGVAPLALGAVDDRREPQNGANDRRYWVSVANRLARPVLTCLAGRELKLKMPVEERPGSNRKSSTYLEAFGRLVCGLAPWLALENVPPDERELQREFIRLTRVCLDAATDPQSPDLMNFNKGGQPLVDTAFLAQGLLRAPKTLWKSLNTKVQTQVIEAFKSSRSIPVPTKNNWVLFAAMVEAVLLEFGEATVEERLEDCLRKMLNWYCGDGAYGDGEFFHFDYYNSFVIHPMLLDVLGVMKRHNPTFASAYAIALERSRRFAEVQERMIAPDGTFPVLGRSTTYRFGAFQALAQIALMGELPPRIKPAQARCALTAVIQKMVEAPGTFDANGWLQIGFCGHQPSLGESYISTGSLYLCAAGLLPLGIPADATFWSAPGQPWTSQMLWSGENLPADHALSDVRPVDLPSLKR